MKSNVKNQSTALCETKIRMGLDHLILEYMLHGFQRGYMFVAIALEAYSLGRRGA
ncbi:hypothetical protein G8770_22465 [Aestuariicella hydrocarbonica]|uniref:Uncharacterized protein n=1 Tax=Pseudomaricurvus hydrocarbonicus TaxID=1470433 RepID=A0A9E5T2D1_9GAMM|nr:hypothetical protein [Aestuariicella hydrocarbonica]NHO68325.1 hypothetical protein [Aestuariicella hydrocarbonica]